MYYFSFGSTKSLQFTQSRKVGEYLQLARHIPVLYIGQPTHRRRTRSAFI